MDAPVFKGDDLSARAAVHDNWLAKQDFSDRLVMDFRQAPADIPVIFQEHASSKPAAATNAAAIYRVEMIFDGAVIRRS
jgi:hypothetical protein